MVKWHVENDVARIQMMTHCDMVCFTIHTRRLCGDRT